MISKHQFSQFFSFDETTVFNQETLTWVYEQILKWYVTTVLCCLLLKSETEYNFVAYSNTVEEFLSSSELTHATLLNNSSVGMYATVSLKTTLKTHISIPHGNAAPDDSEDDIVEWTDEPEDDTEANHIGKSDNHNYYYSELSHAVAR